MNQKIKWVLGCVGLVVVVGGASLLYQNLSANYRPADNLAPIASAASSQTVSDAQENNSSAMQEGVQSQSSAPEKIKAPDFIMEDAAGNQVKFSDLEGKPVVLNFWATWCGYCAVEMPDFDEVYAEMGEEVQFIMLDVVDGVRETKEKGMEYIAEKGYSFPVYYDTLMEGGNAYGIRSLPTTIFIDKDGYLVTMAQGMVDKETLLKGINLAHEQGKS